MILLANIPTIVKLANRNGSSEQSVFNDAYAAATVLALWVCRAYRTKPQGNATNPRGFPWK
jgi:hypothetical protein